MRAVLLAGVVLVAGLPASADDEAKVKAGAGVSTAGERHHAREASRTEAARSDEARSRGGSGEARAGRDSGGSRADSGGGRSSRASASNGSDEEPRRTPSGAERRHPRAGTGTGDRDRYGRSGGYYGGGYYGGRYYGSYYRRPYYYGRPYYWGFYYPYDYYWGYYDGVGLGYYGGYEGYYPRRHYGSYRTGGAVRLLVDPEKTQVYVDGYYAGLVDDFDGMFQRLYISPGRHEIMLKLEGYQTHRVKVYVGWDGTLKIRHDMARGSADVVTDQTVGEPRTADERERFERWADRDDEDDEGDRDERGYRRSPADRSDRERGERGTLQLEVRPSDASVYVDGEFRGSAREAQSLVLTPGRHRIEVVRPGFRTLDREVEIRPGRTEEITIALEKS